MTSSKQFVIERILDQARLEGVSLTDIEIRMLKFTEATSSSKDLEAAEAFDRNYNDEEYEGTIADLVRHVHARDKETGNKQAWDDALAHLAGCDLYLNVMIDRAGIAGNPFGPFGDWRFFLVGLVPPALCLAVAVLIGLSPIGARFIHSELLRAMLAIFFLAAPFALMRHSNPKPLASRMPVKRG
jgi:hypothetical protein